MDECELVVVFSSHVLRSIIGIIPSDGEEHLIKDNVSLPFHDSQLYLIFPIQELRRHLVDVLPIGSNLVVRVEVYY